MLPRFKQVDQVQRAPESKKIYMERKENLKKNLVTFLRAHLLT